MIEVHTDAEGHTYTTVEGSDLVLVAAYGVTPAIEFTRAQAREQWNTSARRMAATVDIEAGRRTLHGW